jgi:hypothetical protein
MNTKMKKNGENCEICYKIKCKHCDWEPDEKELSKVLSGALTDCPDCGFAK